MKEQIEKSNEEINKELSEIKQKAILKTFLSDTEEINLKNEVNLI